MVSHWFKKSKMITFAPLIVVMLALLLAVACGSTAAPDTTAPDTTAPDRAACRHGGSQTGSHSCPGLGLGSEGPPRQSNRDGTRSG